MSWGEIDLAVIGVARELVARFHAVPSQRSQQDVPQPQVHPLVSVADLPVVHPKPAEPYCSMSGRQSVVAGRTTAVAAMDNRVVAEAVAVLASCSVKR